MMPSLVAPTNGLLGSLLSFTIRPAPVTRNGSVLQMFGVLLPGKFVPTEWQAFMLMKIVLHRLKSELKEILPFIL